MDLATSWPPLRPTRRAGHRGRARLTGALLAAAAAAAPDARAGAQPISAAPSLCDGTVGNLVHNCGFELGTPDGWTVAAQPGGDLAIADLPTSAHSGSHMLRVSGFATSTVMVQLPTVPGARYTFSFYLVSLGIGGEPPSSSFFQAYWGGRPVFNLVGQGPTFDAGYQQYRFVGTALDALTEIRFDARNAAAAYNLDDVSVTLAPAVTTPEPATLALAAGGLLTLGAFARMRRDGAPRHGARRDGASGRG